MMNMRRAATTLVAAMTVAAAGCGGGDSSGATGPGGRNQLGLYALMQANKKAIPTEIYRGPYFDETIPHFFNQFIVKITGGELILQEDDRYRLALDLYLNGDGQETTLTLPVEGDFEIDGNEITMWPDGAPEAVTAAIRNGTVTYVRDATAGGPRTELVFKYRP